MRIILGSEQYSGAAGAVGLLTSATLWMSGGIGNYAASYDLDGGLTSERYTYIPTSGTVANLYQVQPTSQTNAINHTRGLMAFVC